MPLHRADLVERERAGDVVELLAEAFYDYPAMRFFLADAGEKYERHLSLLMRFFTEARYLRGDAVLAVAVGGELAAAACIVLPETVAPPALGEHRERLWAELGAGASERYEAFGRATSSLPWPAEPHHYLALIGVRPRHAGSGLARPLLEAVLEMSRSHSSSRGVGLTTESPANLGLYDRFGYRRIGHARVSELETWGFFREGRKRSPGSGPGSSPADHELEGASPTRWSQEPS